MPAHLSREDLEAYQRKALRPADLLVVSRHLSECPECASRLRAQIGSAGLPALAAADDEDHLSYDQLAAYVDGRLAAREREEFDAHISQCRHCAGDLEELREFAAQMQVQPIVLETWRARLLGWFGVPRMAMAASALAVMTVLTASFLLIHRSVPPPVEQATAVQPRETAPPPNLSPRLATDILTGVKELTPTDRDAIAAAFRGESSGSPVPAAGVVSDEAIQQARRQDPNAHLHLGALYQQRGMWTEAEHEYRLLLDANPASQIARRLWENAHRHAAAR